MSLRMGTRSQAMRTLLWYFIKAQHLSADIPCVARALLSTVMIDVRGLPWLYLSCLLGPNLYFGPLLR
jgi:hypothetical protein